MNSLIIRSKQMAKTAFFVLLAKMVSFIKCSFIVGSMTAFFSGVNAITPLAGAFGGGLGAAVFCAIRMIFSLCVGGGLPFKMFAYYIPGFVAGLSWAYPSFVLRVALPLTCMILFIAHPVGAQSFAYSLYWLIPVILYFMPQKNTFFTALSSTFVAHALGAVIWLYALSMTPEVWNSLIPIVAIERLLFAAGMVVMHKGIAIAFARIDAFARVRGYVFAR